VVAGVDDRDLRGRDTEAGRVEVARPGAVRAGRFAYCGRYVDDASVRLRSCLDEVTLAV
jgi:hypothetical protein